MLYDQVQFDGVSALSAEGPVRLDIACVLGFLAPREGAVAAPDLSRWLERGGYLSRAEIAGEVPVSLIDRPVPVRSLADVERYFNLDARLDRLAELRGGVIPGVIGAETALEPFGVTVDGRLHEVSLDGVNRNTRRIAAHLDAALDGVSVWIDDSDAGRRLHLRREPGRGPGTLSVLAHPVLGFHRAMHVAARPVGTAMGAALRQVFAMGAREAIVISLGAPRPVLSPPQARATDLARLLAVDPDGIIAPMSFTADFPPAHIEASARHGLSHLFGLEEAGLLLLPDLPDLVAGARAAAPDLPGEPRAMPGFAECLPRPTSAPRGRATDLGAPLCDAPGRDLWMAAMARITGFLGQFRRDMIALAALPELAPGLELLPGPPASELVMLASPFVITDASAGQPGGVMGADAVLGGQLAAHLAGPSPHGSMAATPVRGLRALAAGTHRTRHAGVCWLTQGPGAFRFASDVMADAQGIWRSGPARRMMARLLKHAQRLGGGLVFEPISDRLMREVALSFETVLRGIEAEGGLRPGPGDPGYTVLCDRTTTSAQDRESGRLRAKIGFRPSSPIEMIRVLLPVGGGFPGAAGGTP